jgi:hypothetical protein
MSRWHICAWLAVTAFCAVILGSGTGAHGASEVEIGGDLAPWPNSSPPTPEEAFGEVELRGMAWAEMVDGEVEVEGLRLSSVQPGYQGCAVHVRHGRGRRGPLLVF